MLYATVCSTVLSHTYFGLTSIFDLYSITWSSIDWVYSATSSNFSHSFIVKAYAVSGWLFDNNFFFCYEIMARLAFGLHGFEIFISSLLDSFVKDFLIKFELSEDQFRRSISLLDPTMFSLFHPNATAVSKSLNANFFLRNFTKLQLALIDLIEKNSLLLPLQYCFQLLITFYILFLFFIFYCSFFSNNKEEFQADIDYAAANMSSEAEKELFSIDDATCLFLLLFFIFASYFGFFFIVMDINYVEFLTFFASIPFVVVILLLMPCNLIFDFGLLFVAYLRGVANTSSFFFELAYDYIGIAAFFTRLTVQFVRLVLMFVVFCLMHDTVVLFYTPMRASVFGDSFWEEICAVRPTLRSVSFFFVLVLPARIGYWMYEVLHTFFVVTVQFAAFFTIIFWLFLLFYTFFVYEEYEHYFIHLRDTSEKLAFEMKKNKNLRK